MKKFKKFGLLCVMFLVLAAALLLPKFVQSTAPPKSDPEAELAATLAEIEIEESDPEILNVSNSEDDSVALKSDPRFKDFFTALEAQDFEKARGSYLSLNKKVSETEKQQLSDELEQAVSKMAKVSPQPAVTNETANMEKPSPMVQPAPTASLDSAALNEANAATAELIALQKESIAQLKASAKELAAATEAARSAAEEASKARKEVTAVKPPSTPEVPTEVLEPLELPDSVSIAFAINSTSLSRNDKKTLAPVVQALKEEPRLSLQLRGFTDPSGSAEYNAILAKARCEMIRDMFIEEGIEGKRLSVVSFGETQFKRGDIKSRRRVELVFREQ